MPFPKLSTKLQSSNINNPSTSNADGGKSSAKKIEVKRVRSLSSLKNIFSSLFNTIRHKPSEKRAGSVKTLAQSVEPVATSTVARVNVKENQQNTNLSQQLKLDIQNGVELKKVTYNERRGSAAVYSQSPLLEAIRLRPVLKKVQDSKDCLLTQRPEKTVGLDKTFPVISNMSDNVPPPPPPPPPAPILPFTSAPKASSAQSTGGKDALFTAISTFDIGKLKKTGIAADILPTSAKQELIDEIYSDELLKTAPCMDENSREVLCQQISDYIVSAMEVDWEGILLEQFGMYADIDTLETAMKGQTESISSYWAEVKRFPDLWKQADVVSDLPFVTKRKGVIAEVMNRLNSGQNRLFRSDNTRGANEMKKGEAIQEGARRIANQRMTGEEKLNLLDKNYHQAALNVLTEMPFMEDFAVKNGKDAITKLEKQFIASIHSSESLKTDISIFLAPHMKTGFADFSFLRQEALVKKQADLINELQLKLTLLTS
ncbi:actin-binding protein [Shewanella sp. M16]|uniref:actin-binding protein n=1 Tax=Shewanella sp. M16 TaxID=2830837 RepID=UPI001BAF86CF|nr:actin-binding protein [Shewanella sp. M16]MBS0045185.1 actin-binding protein [Shewanella sp. M16]